MTKPGRARLDALYETDLERFLDQFGLLDAFRANTLFCTQCNDSISVENLYGFISKSATTVQPICSKPSCIDAVYGHNPGTDDGDRDTNAD